VREELLTQFANRAFIQKYLVRRPCTETHKVYAELKATLSIPLAGELDPAMVKTTFRHGGCSEAGNGA